MNAIDPDCCNDGVVEAQGRLNGRKLEGGLGLRGRSNARSFHPGELEIRNQSVNDIIDRREEEIVCSEEPQ